MKFLLSFISKKIPERSYRLSFTNFPSTLIVLCVNVTPIVFSKIYSQVSSMNLLMIDVFPVLNKEYRLFHLPQEQSQILCRMQLSFDAFYKLYDFKILKLKINIEAFGFAIQDIFLSQIVDQDIMKRFTYLLLVIVMASCQYPWVKPDNLNRGLPPSISIYTLKTETSPFGTRLTGGYAKFNMNDTNLEFVVKDTNGDALGYYPKTPMQYAEQQQNVVYAVINGGYFDMVRNTSASFLAENWKVKSKNGINQGTNIHPTVGAFGYAFDGKFAAEYIYSYGTQLKTYKFPHPNSYPGPVINPAQGIVWNVKEAIGAGPILIKSNNIIDGNVEHFGEASMIDMRHPRSAICVDISNNLYFVAIDGRYSDSDGMKMPQIAHLMKSLKCLDAMNLDGGGSTLLYANNFIINHPSDASGPRKVVSAVLIRDKYKKKLDQTSI